MKSYLIILKHSPYESSQALEAIEFAQALSAFNQKVSLLFLEEGILQLLAHQDGKQILAKDFTKVYEGLSLFDIHDIYISQDSLQKYSELDLIIEPQVVDQFKIAQLMDDHDIVLTL